MMFQPSVVGPLAAQERPTCDPAGWSFTQVMSRQKLATTTRRVIATSLLHRPATITRSLVIEQLIWRHRAAPEPATNYCVSPYKTATTFIANLFEGAKARHEPLHYLTLKNIEDSDFLACRRRYLRLELECSGFLSLVAPEELQTSADRRALFIIREPADWVSSVIDYFTWLARDVSYNYIEELFFSRIDAAGVSRFHTLSDREKSRVAESLLAFWVKTYRAAQRSDRCFIVRLDELGSSVDRIEHNFGMKATNRAAWRRENRQRSNLDVRSLVDFSNYARDIAALGY